MKQIPIAFFISFIVFLSSSFYGQNYDTTIVTGAERISMITENLKGKDIAVVANQTSVVGSEHLVDALLANEVNVLTVFAPEHGFRANADAGEKVKDEKDVKTGLPIVSLYGRKNRKPSAELLSNVDIVIFDLQDVGARFYTYISTMHYVMEACAEQGKKMIVLDRPNPNGFYVDGPVLDLNYKSFIGMHPVALVHGMTIGEYALMIKGEKWINDADKLDLEVVTCENYEHSDFYKLPVAPSPNLPNMASVYLYPSLCLFEGTDVSVGRGTEKPFQQFGAPYIESDYAFIPKPMYGAKNPKRNGETCYGYDLSQFGEEHLKEIGKLYLHWIIAVYGQSDNTNDFFRNDGFFNLLAGNKTLREAIENKLSSEEIEKGYREELVAFKELRKKYLLYEDFE